jgi:4-amino-4-deoxy-L-arabinose transferase-like glycosyltransferase
MSATLLVMATLSAPDGAVASLCVAVLGLAAIASFRRYADDRSFVTNVFLASLIARLLFGIVVQVFDLREFFGGDANTYDFRGNLLMGSWFGHVSFSDPEVRIALSTSGSGWGMNYLVAFVYTIIGRNIFAAQSICAVFGAATAPMVYFCSEKVFQNRQVAKTAAVFVAIFPAFIIWSGQLLKDGLIIFLLVFAMTMVLQLQEKFSLPSVVLLVSSLGGILTLRFYIFFMVAMAVAGSFVIGFTSSANALIRNVAILVLVGLGLTYFGITRNASTQIEHYGSFEQMQRSREDLARSANSGFGEDVDVSTANGAISAIPLGLAYLMLAPFPWEASTLRQSITLPEVFIWWAMIPLMIWGIWWAIKHRLKRAFPILIFSLMLTLAYSVFLGNVGTAYRQRTQIQVFLFIFIAVGFQLLRERRQDKRLRRLVHERRGHPIQAQAS